mgnify:CR=1 FL=1
MLKHVILALLSRGELNGYEIKKRFDSSIVFFWHATSAQIYAELKRMEAEGLIAGRDLVQEKYPTKRLYHLTEQGRATLLEWLREPSGLQRMKDDMQLRTFVFDLLPPEDAIVQLAHHREAHQRRLSEYEAIRQRLETRYGPVDSVVSDSAFFSHVSLEYGIRHEQTYIEWCDWAIERVRSRFGAASGTATALDEQARVRGGEQSTSR